MNKKLFLILMISAFVFSAPFLGDPAQAAVCPPQVSDINIDENCSSEADIIKRAGLKNKFQKSDETKINDLFKKYNKYSENNKFEKLKELYSDDFTNNDGFDKKTIFQMIEDTEGLYKNVKYTSVIGDIKINGRYASVRVNETAQAEITNPPLKIPDVNSGTAFSQTEYIDGLIKEGNKWKIQTSQVLSEKVIIKYGEAENINIDIEAPDFVPAGAGYEVSLKSDIPKDIYALGSITNEKIVYPQEQNKNVFRSIRKNQLARIITANKENKNEYASIIAAFARTETKPSEIHLNITGAAFLMKRVNIIKQAERKEAENGAE